MNLSNQLKLNQPLGGNYAAQAQAAHFGVAGVQQAAPIPRTVNSAIARMEGLASRLTAAIAVISDVAESIGGPRPMGGDTAKPAQPPATSAVGRLNELADIAHDQVAQIEDALAAIQRSLG